MPGGLGGQALLPQSFFLVLEGGEGSGKTSLLARLPELLGNYTDVTREPGGTPEGLKLRELFLKTGGLDWEAEAELLLLMSARIQHVKRRILPSLRLGYPVVCDRFLSSTIAYQGAGRGLSEDMIRALHLDFACGLIPDFTIYLDVDPRIGLERSRRRLSAAGIDEGRFETLDLAFHDRVRKSFLAQAADTPEQSVVIDATRAFFEVQFEAFEQVKAWLTRRGVYPLGYHHY